MQKLCLTGDGVGVSKMIVLEGNEVCAENLATNGEGKGWEWSTIAGGNEEVSEICWTSDECGRRHCMDAIINAVGYRGYLCW